VSMTNSLDRIEVITSVQRRRRWSASEKLRMVDEAFALGMTVRLVARKHGVAPSQLFTWWRLVAQGALTVAGAGEERGGPGCLNRFSASISGASAGVKLPSGLATC